MDVERNTNVTSHDISICFHVIVCTALQAVDFVNPVTSHGFQLCFTMVDDYCWEGNTSAKRFGTFLTGSHEESNILQECGGNQK